MADLEKTVERMGRQLEAAQGVYITKKHKFQEGTIDGNPESSKKPNMQNKK